MMVGRYQVSVVVLYPVVHQSSGLSKWHFGHSEDIQHMHAIMSRIDICDDYDDVDIYFLLIRLI